MCPDDIRAPASGMRHGRPQCPQREEGPKTCRRQIGISPVFWSVRQANGVRGAILNYYLQEKTVRRAECGARLEGPNSRHWCHCSALTYTCKKASPQVMIKIRFGKPEKKQDTIRRGRVKGDERTGFKIAEKEHDNIGSNHGSDQNLSKVCHCLAPIYPGTHDGRNW